MLKKFYAFLSDTSGVTGIEYGLMLGGIGITVMTGAFIAGDHLTEIFSSLGNYMTVHVTTVTPS